MPSRVDMVVNVQLPAVCCLQAVGEEAAVCIRQRTQREGEGKDMNRQTVL